MGYEIKQDAKQRRMESIRVRIAAGAYKVTAVDLADAILRDMQKQQNLGQEIEEEGRAA